MPKVCSHRDLTFEVSIRSMEGVRGSGQQRPGRKLVDPHTDRLVRHCPAGSYGTKIKPPQTPGPSQTHRHNSRRAASDPFST
jgi:hypothetical protein